ncbi:MAG TPA: patatin-like phospholipase family protein [Candidatus Acidoferrum sp.]|nr:patatin-like phospholipase family protein [Candidatus Acidoferrum sp.]
MSVSDKLRPTPQKKMLALDGGGIRGVITLEVLDRMETILRETKGLGSPNFRLADYFDYIAGTSTGAIIAAALSMGMGVSEISHFYHSIAKEMFSPAGYLKRFRYKYEDKKLSDQLREVFGASTTLGSDKIRTLLMMVMRNATTDSPWPVCNNPRAKYNDRHLPDCNLELPLWQLVRASTAAPTFFPPELVYIGNQEFLFVDGGVTTYNNPAFQLFLMATAEPYQLQWLTGVDKMLLVSVGTGSTAEANASLHADDMNLLYSARSIPSALIFAAQNEQDFLCRVFGDCLVGPRLDSEVGDMKMQKGPTDSKLFTYMRLNAELTQTGLGYLGFPNLRPEDVQPLDSVDHIEELRQIGLAIAKRDLQSTCFDRF